MKLSVVIPIYNVAPYLQRCLDSVLAQVECDWECICVDDGSMDGSGMILSAYSERDSRIKVIAQKNAGVSAARNAALETATGEWVMMLDGDDTWDENLLTGVFAEIASHPNCDAVCFGVAMVNEKGEKIGELGRDDAVPAVMTGDQVLGDIRGPYSKFIWSSCDKVYRRSTIERIHLRYAEGMTHSEDTTFSSIFLAHAGEVVLRPDILGYHYYMRTGSAIHVQRTSLPENPFRQFELLHAHWEELRTPGLKLFIYNIAINYFSMGKSPDFASPVRSQAIEVLVGSKVFSRTICPFVIRFGGLKARMFAIAYLLSPRALRRSLLKAL